MAQTRRFSGENIRVAIFGVLFLVLLVVGSFYALIKPTFVILKVFAAICLLFVFLTSVNGCRYVYLKWKKSPEEGWHGSDGKNIWCYDPEKWTVRTTSKSGKIRTMLSLFGAFLVVLLVVGLLHLLIKPSPLLYTLVAVFCLLVIFSAGVYGYLKWKKSQGGGRQEKLNYEFSLEEVLNWCLLQIPSNEDVDHIDLQTRRNFSELKRFLRENDFFGEVDIMLAGSTAERYNAPLSPHWAKASEKGAAAHAIITDFDYMVSPRDWKAYFTDKEKYKLILKSIKTYRIISEIYNLQLGHVYLQRSDNDNIQSAKETKKGLFSYVERLDIKYFGEFVKENEELICSSCFEDKQKNHGSLKIKGPAIELRFSGLLWATDRFWSDITFSIKCDEWPYTISNWTDRESRKWPCQKDVDNIAKHGCHIVPKSQENDTEGLSWRISFSQAEVLLSKIVPHLARMCFIGLKIIAKDHLAVHCNKLKSFQLKCIFLFTLEKSEPSMWLNGENTSQCFDMLLLSLLEALMTKSCPHFWIPEINLFEDFTEKQFNKLSERLLEILESPERYIVPFTLPSHSEGIELKNQSPRHRDYGTYSQEFP